MLMEATEDQIRSIAKALRSDRLYSYSAKEYFINTASEFLVFMQNSTFMPSREAAREYLIAVGGISNEGDARDFEGDIDQVLRGYIPALQNHFYRNQSSIMQQFVTILMDNIFSVRTTVSARYNTTGRLDKNTLVKLIDVLSHENPLPELTVMDVIEADAGFDQANNEMREKYEYKIEHDEAQPYIKTIKQKLLGLCYVIANTTSDISNTKATQQQALNVLLKTLQVIVGGHKDHHVNEVLAHGFTLQNTMCLNGDWRPTVVKLSPDCILNTTDVLGLWGAVDHDKTRDYSTECHLGLSFIVNMIVVNILQSQDNKDADCCAPTAYPKSY